MGSLAKLFWRSGTNFEADGVGSANYDDQCSHQTVARTRIPESGCVDRCFHRLHAQRGKVPVQTKHREQNYPIIQTRIRKFRNSNQYGQPAEFEADQGLDAAHMLGGGARFCRTSGTPSQPWTPLLVGGFMRSELYDTLRAPTYLRYSVCSWSRYLYASPRVPR